VLPVLLQDVGPRMKELGIDPTEMLYLDATDQSDDGIAASETDNAGEVRVFKSN